MGALPNLCFADEERPFFVDVLEQLLQSGSVREVRISCATRVGAGMVWPLLEDPSWAFYRGDDGEGRKSAKDVIPAHVTGPLSQLLCSQGVDSIHIGDLRFESYISFLLFVAKLGGFEGVPDNTRGSKRSRRELKELTVYSVYFPDNPPPVDPEHSFDGMKSDSAWSLHVDSLCLDMRPHMVTRFLLALSLAPSTAGLQLYSLRKLRLTVFDWPDIEALNGLLGLLNGLEEMDLGVEVPTHNRPEIALALSKALFLRKLTLTLPALLAFYPYRAIALLHWLSTSFTPSDERPSLGSATTMRETLPFALELTIKTCVDDIYALIPNLTAQSTSSTHSSSATATLLSDFDETFASLGGTVRKIVLDIQDALPPPFPSWVPSSCTAEERHQWGGKEQGDQDRATQELEGLFPLLMKNGMLDVRCADGLRGRRSFVYF